MTRMSIALLVLCFVSAARLAAQASPQGPGNGGFPCWRCMWDNWNWPPQEWCVSGFGSGAQNCVSGTGWCAEINPDACIWTGALRTDSHQLLADGSLWSASTTWRLDKVERPGGGRTEVRACSGVVLAAFYSSTEAELLRRGLRAVRL